MAKANVTIVEAPMGEGKTNTVTGILVDDYFSHLKGMVSPTTGVWYPVQPIKGEIVKMFPPDGVQGEPKIVKIPPTWLTVSDTKIFCNYHLYGLRYIFCEPKTMLEYLNEGAGQTMKHAKMVLDEAYLQGEARRGMNSLSLIYTWFAQQMRKRDIELFLIVQHGRFIDWRFRYIAKRKILCRYNEKTHMIRLLVQNLTKGTEKPFSFWAPQYWKYYDTNELPTVPQEMIQRASKWA